MVRTEKCRHEDEDEDDESISRTSDCSSQKGRRNGNKLRCHRSKHSETEQRRRIKINERFQILRDLIPENDQKRDQASFLLEVIQYIQFLHEKLQVYEGTYQGWSSESTKSMPWRGNGGVGNSIIDQSQLLKNGSVDEETIVLNSALLMNAQNLVESELNAPAACKATVTGSATEVVSFDMPLQPNLLESGSIPPPQGPFSDAERLASHSRSPSWNGGSVSTAFAIPNSTPHAVKADSDEGSISDAYSRGLLDSLTNALGSSGVDLSQASISVQLDVRKGKSSESTTSAFGIKNLKSLSCGKQVMAHYGAGISSEDCDQVHKRLRVDQI